jgi:hypothetical protein
MTSHPVPFPVLQMRDRMRAHVAHRALPVWTAIAILAALLILFGWLHLILAVEIISIDREILNQTQMLERVERDKAATRREIAEAQSPKHLEPRSRLLGFQPQQPAYLLLSKVPADKIEDGTLRTNPFLTTVNNAEESTAEAGSLFETVVSESGKRFEIDTTP